MRREPDILACARVVEARSDLDYEARLAAHGGYPANQPVAMLPLAGVRRGHEVLHLPHSLWHEEARDENVGVGQVELLRGPAIAVR